MNLGALIAPFLAGIVYSRAGYYAVFGMILGLLGIDFILQGVMIEKRAAVKWFTEGPTTTSFNPEMSREQCEGTLVSDNESRGEATVEEQPRSPNSGVEETSSLLKKPENIDVQQSWFRRQFPRMTVLLSSPRMLTAFLGCFTHTTLTACFDTVLPLFVKRMFHWDSTGAGLIFLCITIPTILGPLVGQLSDRFGPRKMTLIGFVVTTPSLGLMGLVRNDSLESKIGLCALLTIIGECFTRDTSKFIADSCVFMKELDVILS